MGLPSLTTILSVLFLAYMANSLWSIAQLFLPPSCPTADAATPGSCLTSMLAKSPERTLLFFSSLSVQPNVEKDLELLGHFDVDDPEEMISRQMQVELPEKVTKNGTLYLAVFTVPQGTKKKDADYVKENWHKLIAAKHVTYTMVPFTVHQVPEAETFNLLGGETPKENPANKKQERPVTHLRSKVTVSMMTDNVDIPTKEIPGELYYLMRTTPDKLQYLPIVYIDELSLRIRDLVIVNKTDKSAAVEFTYRPISFGKLRLFLQFTAALSSMQGLGFTPKDTDEVKGIFVDTNMVLLLVTFGVSAVHLLFDFLAFKNDISFWRQKKTMEGLSSTTVLWRAFSQSIVFLYLMDEKTSLLVLIPSGIAAIIEMWKVTKAFKVGLVWSGWRPTLRIGDDASKTESEKSTEAFDGQSMKYLSYVLYPLCVGGAIYSLLYTPHKSWWSWTIQSLVNGVYAFGFLFMLPQLFVNYKLKSVAHLPWRSFMYKAFNTFIDDLFAFIITMPTAHRVACFRDDVVFIIYLYQRYLYPVDKSRIDMSGMIEESPAAAVNDGLKSKKED